MMEADQVSPCVDDGRAAPDGVVTQRRVQVDRAVIRERRPDVHNLGVLCRSPLDSRRRLLPARRHGEDVSCD